MILGKNYIEKDMLFIVKSEIRLKILTELNDEPQTIKDIVNKTNIAYSSVSNNMNKLEYKNHVTKENRVYTMTPMTKLYFNQLMEFKKSVDVIKNFDSLWYKHDINNINTELIKNITELYESKLIETDPIDIYKTHNNIRKQLENSKNIRGILPYIHPDYPKLINGKGYL
ncbi:winged helix-turn-helix domain-containing protein [uncultured Methanobrevibacter sp.]|uniref:helix-turn-helix transcriptional regulator n=1 Tax=uncultured Methanobrevibacter sp. TaxID=253161 RepID=UPI0025E8B07A|nr:ArsR family transcriptional regulator [uncultured Methanobrevibacter sp.]